MWQVLASLAQHDASKEELALLRPLVKRGQKETKREGLARALRMQRAGLQLPEGFMELERSVKVPGAVRAWPLPLASQPISHAVHSLGLTQTTA